LVTLLEVECIAARHACRILSNNNTPHMSLASVKAFFAEHGPELSIIELGASTATVALAAAAHKVHPGQIAKTLSLRVGEGIVLVVICGDARLDNKKFKAIFGVKAKMLDAAEVEARTSHPVGGVCPFGVPPDVAVYCDLALTRFEQVLPAAGAVNAAVRLSPQRMASLAGATWVDVVQAPVPVPVPVSAPVAPRGQVCN
jgi:prolyl-tRNA editing enzyme YbaK/EbsC (Cys-tRNA(Pro) deacylase)